MSDRNKIEKGYTKEVKVTWTDVMHFVDKMVEEYKDKPITGIYGVPKGGLIIATILAYRLKVPLLLAPCKGCIVFDDICDTGKTLLHYAEEGYEIVTMFHVPFSHVIPNFCYMQTTDWMVFPWE